MRVSGGDLHPAGKEVVGGLRVGLEVQVNHRPGQGWVRRGTRCRGGGQPRAGSHLTGGVRLTASEEGAKGLLPELPLKRLKLPIKESFSSSIRADHPFLQLNEKQKGLVFPEGTLLCRRKERATSVSYLTGDFPQGGEMIMPGGGYRSARWLTQEGYKFGLRRLVWGEV